MLYYKGSKVLLNNSTPGSKTEKSDFGLVRCLIPQVHRKKKKNRGSSGSQLVLVKTSHLIITKKVLRSL